MNHISGFRAGFFFFFNRGRRGSEIAYFLFYPRMYRLLPPYVFKWILYPNKHLRAFTAKSMEISSWMSGDECRWQRIKFASLSIFVKSPLATDSWNRFIDIIAVNTFHWSWNWKFFTTGNHELDLQFSSLPFLMLSQWNRSVGKKRLMLANILWYEL